MKQILLCALLCGALGVSAQVRYAIVRTEGAAIYDGSRNVLRLLPAGDTVFVELKNDIDALRTVEHRGGLRGLMIDNDISKIMEASALPKVYNALYMQRGYNLKTVPIAKTNPDTITKPMRTEEYCLIVGTAKFFSTKVIVSIDFGQETEFFDSKRYKDENGKVVNFNSMIDALNYMNSKGWVFINAYPISVGSGSVYHYLMKRTVK
jgi:hypothetical protein